MNASVKLPNGVSAARQAAGATRDSILPLDDGDVYVAQDGPHDGPALVLIHGSGASTRWWDPLVPMLIETHRVVRIDLLGHGRSAKPAGRGYEIPEQARRVGAALDRLGVKRAVVVGHSTGGSVATALAEQRPYLAAALALINTGPCMDAYFPQGFASRLLTAPVLLRLMWWLRTDTLIRKMLSSAFTSTIEIPQNLVDDARGMTYHAITATLQASEDYLRQGPIPDRLAALGKPVLVIFGKEDRRWQSESATSYRTAPGARVELLPGVGHTPMLEDSSRTAELLLGFTRDHGEAV